MKQQTIMLTIRYPDPDDAPSYWDWPEILELPERDVQVHGRTPVRELPEDDDE